MTPFPAAVFFLRRLSAYHAYRLQYSVINTEAYWEKGANVEIDDSRTDANVMGRPRATQRHTLGKSAGKHAGRGRKRDSRRPLPAFHRNVDERVIVNGQAGRWETQPATLDEPEATAGWVSFCGVREGEAGARGGKLQRVPRTSIRVWDQ